MDSPHRERKSNQPMRQRDAKSYQSAGYKHLVRNIPKLNWENNLKNRIWKMQLEWIGITEFLLALWKDIDNI